jgi:hypothetical protein
MSIDLGKVEQPPATISCNQMRTFNVTLHELNVLQVGDQTEYGGDDHSDMQLFVDVGGRWQYLNGLPTNSDPSIPCVSSEPLTSTTGLDCYQFDQSPFKVSVQDGRPIHIEVEGYEREDVDPLDYVGVSEAADQAFCRSWNGCDPDSDTLLALAYANDEKLPAIELDLTYPTYGVGTTVYKKSQNQNHFQYEVVFNVAEVTAAAGATSSLAVGTPQYTDPKGNLYVTSKTPLVLTTASTALVGFDYRFYQFGQVPPVLSSTPDGSPMFWQATDQQVGPRSVDVYARQPVDGSYLFQWAAQTAAPAVTEPRHQFALVQDSRAPTISIISPVAKCYQHQIPLVPSWSVTDPGSGVASSAATLDGMPLASKTVDLLTMALGTHLFSVQATDRLGQSATSNVNFSVSVTGSSIEEELTIFYRRGMVDTASEKSLYAILDAAAIAARSGNCDEAVVGYEAFVNAVGRAGAGVAPAAARILIADATFLMKNCPAPRC